MFDIDELWVSNRFFFLLILLSFLVLQRLLGGDSPPNKVKEINVESLETLHVIHRDDGMVLYAPQVGDKKNTPYEIVLHRPYSENFNTSYR